MFHARKEGRARNRALARAEAAGSKMERQDRKGWVLEVQLMSA
jgi:hypothetical protein